MLRVKYQDCKPNKAHELVHKLEEEFGHSVCPNSMRVNADEIMLYTDDEKI